MGALPILIVYGSSYGQTAKIARRIGTRLGARGFSTELADAATASDTLSPANHAGCVIGSSVIAHGIQPAVRQFVELNRHALNDGLSAFFQVSASAGSADPEGRREALEVMDAFLAHSKWQPQLTASIAGAVNYTKYGFLLRWYMRRASRKHGGATDTSRDHEYTDWNQVDRFADDVADAIEERARTSYRELQGAP